MLVQNQCKTLSGLIAAAFLAVTTPLFAETTARVFAVQPAAWLQQGETIQVLKVGDEIAAGARIVTGDQGRIEIRVGDRLRLRQNTSSEILLQIDAAGGAPKPDLVIQAGKSCVEVHRATGNRHRFVVALGSTMTVTLHNESKICALHQDGLSSVHLREGSVQINHSVDPNIIVLSESGSEFQVEFGESYSVLLPEVGRVYQIANEGFPLAENFARVEPEPVPQSVEVEPAAVQVEAEPAAESVEVEPALEAITLEETPAVETAATVEPSVVSEDADSEYVYTVYLFSTRDEDVANEVNQRFQRVGYPTQIYSSESGGTTRFRIVVTGFDSRDSARQFSDSVIGKHGISDTWIGHERRALAE